MSPIFSFGPCPVCENSKYDLRAGGGQSGLGSLPAHPLSHQFVIISGSFLLSDSVAVSVLF